MNASVAKDWKNHHHTNLTVWHDLVVASVPKDPNFVCHYYLIYHEANYLRRHSDSKFAVDNKHQENKLPSVPIHQ